MPTRDTDYDDDLDNDGHDEQPEGGGNWRRKLERELKTLRAENATLKTDSEKATRSLAFAKAGVPLDDPKARYFINGYDGELTPEAIKAEAATLGLVAEVEAPKDEIPPAEKDAHQRISDASAGAGSGGARDWTAEINAATTREEVQRLHREAAAASVGTGVA